MFGLFTPSCPIDLESKVWIERRMLWFVSRFGARRLLDAKVVEPTREFLPDEYTPDYEGARRVQDRMCGYLGIAPEAVTLEVLPDHLMPAAAGLYEKREQGHIRIAESQLANPPRLIATVIHELAHEILLRGEHLTGLEPEHEQTTDLLPVFLGAGIFGANATLQDSSGWEANTSWWSITKQGYLSSLQLGYALALFAHARGEAEPAWRHHLRTDARETLDAGRWFLRKTGDTLFTPEAVAAAQPAPTPDAVLARFAARSPTLRLAALWDVVESGVTDPRVCSAVARALNDPDDTLRVAAVSAVSVFGSAADELVPKLVELLGDRAPQVRVAATQALGLLRPGSAEVLTELARLLADREAASEAAKALFAYGRDAEPAVPALLAALEHALGVLNDSGPYIVVLKAICPNPQKALRAHFGKRDPDLLQAALGELEAEE